jgi:hypothetical protein
MMETLCSYETSVLKSATRRNIPEDGILHVLLSYTYTNLYIALQLIQYQILHPNNSTINLLLSFTILDSYDHTVNLSLNPTILQ